MAEEENNRIFTVNSFKDGNDEVVCLFDKKYLERNGININDPSFNPDSIIKDKKNLVAARVRIDANTGLLKKVELGMNHLTQKRYSGNDIRCIVNTSAKIQCGDDGRNMPELILSLSSSLYDNRELKKRPNFIPPSEIGGGSLNLMRGRMDVPTRSCAWLKNFINKKKNEEKSKETFFFPWLANGHFGLLCIDMSKDKPITYFDSGDMFISEGVDSIEKDNTERKRILD